MLSPSCATTATAPGWRTISRSTSSPSSKRKRSTSTVIIFPLQACPPPMRSNPMDLLCQDAAAGQGGTEEQLVLADRPAHGTNGESRGPVALDVGLGEPDLVERRRLYIRPER